MYYSQNIAIIYINEFISWIKEHNPESEKEKNIWKTKITLILFSKIMNLITSIEISSSGEFVSNIIQQNRKLQL